MAGRTVLQGDVYVAGQFTAQSNAPSSGTITDAHVSASAAISYSKIEQEHRHIYQQEIATNAVAEGRVIFVARGSGAIVDIEFGQVVPPNTAEGSSGRTITFDLKKNGTTVLSSTVKLNSTNAAYTLSAGTLSSSSLAAGDVLTVHTTMAGASGTYPLGPFARLSVREVGT